MRQKFLFILLLFVSLFGLDVAAQHRPTIDRTLLEVSPTKLQFSCGSGTRRINVKSGSDWKFSVSDASWCHVTKSANGLSLSVDENTTTILRKATIKVGNGKSEKMISISQEPLTDTKSSSNTSANKSSSQTGKNAGFSVSPNNKRFGADGGSQTMTVTGSSNWTIGVNVASWAHLNKNGNNLTLTVDRNSSTSSRSDYFTLKSGEKTFRVDFSQDGQSTTPFSVTPNNKRFGSDGGTQTMTVTGSTNWTIGVNVASWAHLNKNGNNLTLTVDRNSSTSSRSDYFTLKSGEKTFRVDFSQDGQSSIPFSVTPNNKRFGADGGTQAMTVTGSTNWTIGVNVASWAHLNKNGNNLTLTVDRNSSTSSRTDYFILKSGEKEFRVDFSQDGQSTNTFSVSSNNMQFGADGGTRTIAVTSPSNWYIDVTVAPWAHLERNVNSLTLTVSRNNSKSIRSDYFVLKSGEKKIRVDFSQDGQSTTASSSMTNNESKFSSHFLDLQIGSDMFSKLQKYYIGGSYAFIPAHIGFRISVISEFPYAKNITTDKWILSAGPAFRLTKDKSALDIQTYICPAFWDNSLAWDGGFRFGWHSNNRLSLWDISFGVLVHDKKIVPTLGVGVGIATSPLIGAGAVCTSSLNKHPNRIVPHHFVDCNFVYSSSEIKWTGLTFDWNPSRFGVHSSYWLSGNDIALTIGLNLRLFKPERLFDIQLYGGQGLMANINSLNYDYIFDFGSRFNFESHRGFAWYDITVGGLCIDGVLIPTIGCGLALSSLVGGVGALQAILK